MRTAKAQEPLEVLDLLAHLHELVRCECRAVRRRRFRLVVIIPFFRELVELFPVLWERIRGCVDTRGLALGVFEFAHESFERPGDSPAR